MWSTNSQSSPYQWRNAKVGVWLWRSEWERIHSVTSTWMQLPCNQNALTMQFCQKQLRFFDHSVQFSLPRSRIFFRLSCPQKLGIFFGMVRTSHCDLSQSTLREWNMRANCRLQGHFWSLEARWLTWKHIATKCLSHLVLIPYSGSAVRCICYGGR